MASSPPIIEILQFFISKPRIPTDSSKFSVFVRQCSIPLLDRNILKDITEKLNSKITVIKALSDISNMFTFSSSDLETLQQFTNLSESNNRLLLTICFSNCISFLFQNFSETYIDDLINVLTALSFVNNSINKRLTSFLYLTILNNSVSLINDKFSPELISLICQHISSFLSDLPDSLEAMAKILEKAPDDNKESRDEIYLSIQTLLTTFNKESIDFDDTTLTNVIKEKVEILDSETLTLLPLLSKNRPSPNVSMLYSLLPKTFSMKLPDLTEDLNLFCQPVNFEYSEWKNEYETKYNSNNSSNEIVDDLNQGFIEPQIDKTKTTGRYLPEKLKKQLKSILPILNDIYYRHINSFFNAYSDLLKEKYNLKDYLLFQYFITHVKFYHDFEKPTFDALMNDQLFIPSVTLFNCTENFEATSFYREKVVMICIFHGQKYLSILFDMLRNYPFLFAETVIRVMNHLPNVIPSSLCSQSTLQSLLTVQHRLGCISLNMDENERNSAVQARSAVFTLIFDIFMNPLPSDLVLNNFLPALTEKSFSNSLFARLDKEQRISNCIFLKNAFDILRHSNPSDKLVTLLMNYVTNSIINEPETTSTVLLSLFDFLETNQNENILSLTLDLINSMLSKTHHCFFVNGVYSKMSEIIPKVYVTSEKWKDQLFSMLRMNTDVEVGSLFLITNPLMLITVFSVFMNFEEFELLFSAMLKLCDYSSYNRISLYEGEIDLLLLEMIINYPNNFDFRRSFIRNIKDEEDLFNFTIPLFLRIASTRSSEVVAERMLKIISPRENGQFSPIASEFLNRISPLREQFIPISTVAYPIGISPPFMEINDIPFSEYLKNGTIIFWIYVDSFLSMKLQVKSTIFKIDLPKFTFLEMFLLNDSLQCISQQSHKNKPKSEIVFKNLKTNTWLFVVVNFKMTYKTVEMTTQINQSSEMNTLMIPVKSSKSLYAKFVVGTSTRFHGNRGLLSCIYQIDRFYYYDCRFSNSELDDIYQNNSQKACFKYSPVFGFPVSSGYQTKKQIHAKIDNRGPSNLIYVLSYQYPNERFLPIFDFYDKCTPDYSVQLIGSLKGIFGPAVVKTFRFLPYFFIKTKQPLLFKHYLAFFSFLDECRTEKDKFSLINNLLLNFNIWIHAENNELKQIVQHQCTELFNACTSYFLDDNFFRKIFGIVRIYFTNESTEIPLLKLPVKIDIDHGDFIENFDILMQNRAQLSLTSSDIDTYLSTLIMSPDKKFVEHLLSFYPSLLSFKNSNVHPNLILLLTFDFQSNHDLFHLFCKCIYKTAPEFYNASVILSFLISKQFWYVSFLDDINHFPELFVLGIFGALQSDSTIQNNLADLLLTFASDIKKRSRILKCQFWQIWPILFALETEGEIQRKVSVFIAQMLMNNPSNLIQNILQSPLFQDDDNPSAMFLFSSSLKIDNDSLNTIFIILKIFQSMTTLDTIPVQSIILNEIFEEKYQSMSSKDLDVFLKMLFFNRFIKFNLNPISNEFLRCFYRSPFSEESFQPTQKAKAIFSMSDLFDAFHLSNNCEFIFNVNILPTTHEIRHLSQIISKRLSKNNTFLKLFKYLYEYECTKSQKKFDLSIFDSRIYESFYPGESDDELDIKSSTARFIEADEEVETDGESDDDDDDDEDNEDEVENESQDKVHIKKHRSLSLQPTGGASTVSATATNSTTNVNGRDAEGSDSFDESKYYEKQKKIYSLIKKINKIVNNTVLPMLKLSKDVTRYKVIQMIEFFKQFKKPVSEIKTTVIEDPLNSYRTELIEFTKEIMESKSKFSFDFMPNIYIQQNKIKWKRMFTFSSDFNSILLKPLVKHSDEDNYDRHSEIEIDSNKQVMNHILSNINHTKIIQQFECRKITISSSKDAILFICKNMLIINVMKGSHIIIKTSSLRYILTRNRLQKPTAIEFFTTEGLSFLLDFAPKSSSQILQFFKHIRMRNLIEREDSDYAKFVSQSGLVEKWSKGEITNFDFILRLNMHTGRSFQDPQNGVIFPWVLLPDGKKRDLAEPITMQNSNRLQHFIQLLEMNGYMFGTAPSNAMLLAYYFVRMEPYTTLHLKIHDGHYDALERMFRSLPTFFKTLMNGDEWKEATPEFFCFPELFMDLNNRKLISSQSTDFSNLLVVSSNLKDNQNYNTDDSNVLDDSENRNKNQIIYSDSENSEKSNSTENETKTELSTIDEKTSSGENDKTKNENEKENAINKSKNDKSAIKNNKNGDINKNDDDDDDNLLLTDESSDEEEEEEENSRNKRRRKRNIIKYDSKHISSESKSYNNNSSSDNNDNEDSINSSNIFKTNIIVKTDSNESISSSLNDETYEVSNKSGKKSVKGDDDAKSEEEEEDDDKNANNESTATKEAASPPASPTAAAAANNNENNNVSKSSANNENDNNNNNENIHIYQKGDEFQILDLKTDFSSIFDFVYNNRKMLESEYVSHNLGEWVSLLWGTGQSNLFMPYLYTTAWDNDECSKEAIPTMVENLGSVPPKIFDWKLPRRIITRNKCQFDKLIAVKIPKVKSSRNAFIFEKNGLVRVIICFFEGTIQRYSVNFSTKEAEPVYLSPLKLKIPSDAKFVVERETVFVFDEKSERIHCVNFEQLKTVNSKIGSIDFALAGSNFGELITATKSGSVKFWKFPEFVPNSLFSISIESISAVYVNQPYGVFICTTNDGFLRTYSVEQKIQLNSVRLGSKSIVIIEKIISTESFGFIVLFTPGFLYLFTINAFLVKKVAIDFEIYQWTTFKDRNGFDFICCSDPIGNIFVFEAYYPNRMQQIAACHERIISVQYLPSLCAIIAHSSSSTIYFIPYK